jgi:hypothetical protein
LNAALSDRCLVMASILRKPSKGGQSKSPELSTHSGAHQETIRSPDKRWNWEYAGCGGNCPACSGRHHRQK